MDTTVGEVGDISNASISNSHTTSKSVRLDSREARSDLALPGPVSNDPSLENQQRISGKLATIHNHVR